MRNTIQQRSMQWKRTISPKIVAPTNAKNDEQTEYELQFILSRLHCCQANFALSQPSHFSSSIHSSICIQLVFHVDQVLFFSFSAFSTTIYHSTVCATEGVRCGSRLLFNVSVSGFTHIQRAQNISSFDGNDGDDNRFNE